MYSPCNKTLAAPVIGWRCRQWALHKLAVWALAPLWGSLIRCPVESSLEVRAATFTVIFKYYDTAPSIRLILASLVSDVRSNMLSNSTGDVAAKAAETAETPSQLARQRGNALYRKGEFRKGETVQGRPRQRTIRCPVLTIEYSHRRLSRSGRPRPSRRVATEQPVCRVSRNWKLC